MSYIIVGVACIRSRNDAPYGKGGVVKGRTTKACNEWVPPPPKKKKKRGAPSSLLARPDGGVFYDRGSPFIF